jgi:hypothetical protein
VIDRVKLEQPGPGHHLPKSAIKSKCFRKSAPLSANFCVGALLNIFGKSKGVAPRTKTTSLFDGGWEVQDTTISRTGNHRYFMCAPPFFGDAKKQLSFGQAALGQLRCSRPHACSAEERKDYKGLSVLLRAEAAIFSFPQP